MKRFVAIIGTLMALGCGKDVAGPQPPSVVLCLSELHYTVEAASDTLRSTGTVTGGPFCATVTEEWTRIGFAADAVLLYQYTLTSTGGTIYSDQAWPAGWTVRADVFERDGVLTFVNWTANPFWLAWPGTEWRRSPGRLTSTFETVNQYGRVTLRSVWVPR